MTDSGFDRYAQQINVKLLLGHPGKPLQVLQCRQVTVVEMPVLRPAKNLIIGIHTEPSENLGTQQTLQLFHNAFFPAPKCFKVVPDIAGGTGVERLMDQSPPPLVLGGKSGIQGDAAIKGLLSFEPWVFL